MYIYGKNVAREYLMKKERINKVLLSDKFNDSEIIKLLKDNKVKVQYVPNIQLDKKVSGLHQGIILEVDDVKTLSIEELLEKIDKQYPLLIMLDHLEDPHNFGAIIRTAEALGVDGIIIPNDRSVGINATVVKTSAGAISNMSIVRVANLSSTITKLKKNNYWIVGTDMDGTDYTEIDYKMPICIVIGNEGRGISNIIAKNCDYIAKIPMIGSVNSLNASVSCGIVLSEIVRSRKIN